jgi:cell division protease FtsH
LQPRNTRIVSNNPILFSSSLNSRNVHGLRMATPPRALKSSNDEGNDSKSDINGIIMRQLEQPSSSGRKNVEEGVDDSGKKQQRPPNLLQRIAFSIAGIFASIPMLMKSPLSYFNSRILRLAVFFALGSLLSVFGALGSRRSAGPSSLPQEVVYSEFLKLVDSGNVRAARFEEGTGRIIFDLKPHSSQEKAAATVTTAAATKNTKKAADNSKASTSETATVTARGRSRLPRQFYTRHIPDSQLIPRMMTAGVEFGTVRASMKAAMVRVVGTAFALWLPLIPLFIVMRRMLEGRNGTKKAKTDSRNGSVPPITFADVAGVGPAKEELREVVACLRDSRRFAKLGAKLPSGVLLCGPPGTGKTLLAKAVAGEAGVPFMAVSASEFVEMFVGRGAARVRELFAEARKRAPCVIFIDELDAVGGKRGAGLNEERDQTLNQMLTELDGFEGRPGVLLLAATNRPDVLDPALLRPGRLSRRVNVPLPDEEGRAAIASVHLRTIPLEGGVNAIPEAASLIAKLSGGFSGAELANVTNEAAFLAARRESDAVGLEDLVDAISRTRFGVGGTPSTGTFARKVRDWIIDNAGSGKQVRTAPLP